MDRESAPQDETSDAVLAVLFLSSSATTSVCTAVVLYSPLPLPGLPAKLHTKAASAARPPFPEKAQYRARVIEIATRHLQQQSYIGSVSNLKDGQCRWLLANWQLKMGDIKNITLIGLTTVARYFGHTEGEFRYQEVRYSVEFRAWNVESRNLE